MLSASASQALKERLPYLALSGGVLVADRVTKVLVESRFGMGETLTIVADFFRLTYVRNTGVAFGMFAGEDSSVRIVLLSALALAAALMVTIYSLRNPSDHRLLQTALALILGGAVGNLYDRIAYGYVVDFLEFHAGTFYWPTFNIADTAISTGVALLAVEMIRDEIRSRT